LSAYEDVIAEYAASAPPDPLAESRAAATFLRDLAIRDRHRSRTLMTVANASHRILRMPVIGTAATRTLRWLLQKR
jgi:hypothetical protein